MTLPAEDVVELVVVLDVKPTGSVKLLDVD